MAVSVAQSQYPDDIAYERARRRSEILFAQSLHALACELGVPDAVPVPEELVTEHSISHEVFSSFHSGNQSLRNSPIVGYAPSPTVPNFTVSAVAPDATDPMPYLPAAHPFGVPDTTDPVIVS